MYESRQSRVLALVDLMQRIPFYKYVLYSWFMIRFLINVTLVFSPLDLTDWLTLNTDVQNAQGELICQKPLSLTYTQFISWLIWISRLKVSLALNIRLVSPPYIDRVARFKQVGLSLIKIINSRGTNIDPCGTPHLIVFYWERWPMTRRFCLLFSR